MQYLKNMKMIKLSVLRDITDMSVKSDKLSYGNKENLDCSNEKDFWAAGNKDNNR